MFIGAGSLLIGVAVALPCAYLLKRFQLAMADGAVFFFWCKDQYKTVLHF